MNKSLRTLYILGMVVSLLLIGAMLSAHAMAHGWSSLVTTSDGTSNILYALGFWLASGAVAGVVLGKMDSVVSIGNAEGWSRKSALDTIIVALSCTTLRNGYVLQNQIANLWSGPIGVGIVYGICQLLHAVTGVAMFGEYPGYVLMVIPFVTVWKLVEGWSRNAIVRRHLQVQAQKV
jgi:hypothetical protein